MEALIINQAELGIVGWFVVIVLGTFIMGLFNKKDKNENGEDDE